MDQLFLGATSAALNLSTLTSANTVGAGSGYDCVVNGTCSPSATSNKSSSDGEYIPSIGTQPTDQTACSNPGTATFTVVCNGNRTDISLEIKWSKS